MVQLRAGRGHAGGAAAATAAIQFGSGVPGCVLCGGCRLPSLREPQGCRSAIATRGTSGAALSARCISLMISCVQSLEMQVIRTGADYVSHTESSELALVVNVAHCPSPHSCIGARRTFWVKWGRADGRDWSLCCSGGMRSGSCTGRCTPPSKRWSATPHP